MLPEILSHPDVPEEHRSNVFGPGNCEGRKDKHRCRYRIYDQKHAEMILTDEISDKLKQEIKSISTRR